MGKSIRSKREKRLRSIRRELLSDHFAEKEAKRQAVLASIVEAPSSYTEQLDEMKRAPTAQEGPSDAAAPEDREAEEMGDGNDMEVEGEKRKNGFKARLGVRMKGKGKKMKISRRVFKKQKRKEEYPV